MVRKKTKEEFIALAKERHGNDKYDYSKVIYVNNATNVIIICHREDHGEFSQLPNNHTKKNKPSGCPKCAYESIANSCLKSVDQFITEAKNIHGDDTYIYDEVVYINTATNVIIKCKLHGPFP